MKKLCIVLMLSLLFPLSALAGPRLVVTGVTSYTPDKAWNGFTVLAGTESVKLVDMNGNLVHEWDIKGATAFPAKIYPGGYALSNMHPQYREAGQGQTMVTLMDFSGKVVRSFNKLNKVKTPGKGMPLEADGSAWIARSHHDYQIEGSSTGYFAPNTKVKFDGKMLILAHHSSMTPKITDKVQLQDDRIIIIDKSGKIIFDWKAVEHIDEFKNMLDNPDVKRRLNNVEAEIGTAPTDLEYNGFDWFHINCASWLGPNKWYDAGDQRFHPDNIIADSRETSHMFIIDHKTGKVVWQVAPPFTGEDADIGAVYGVHHTHMIPKGLPGAGNILIYDNGGTTSYHKEQLPPRSYSRIVEYDPVTKKKVWEYSVRTASKLSWQLYGDKFFFSAHISSAQRLPNGNTLICEGSASRIFEVTPDYKIVWEYISPYAADDANHSVYRAYRVPYDWVPQLPKGSEVPVTLPVSAAIQIPNDKGDYANVAPKLDTTRAARFNPMTPVSMPGAKGGPAASKVVDMDDEDDEPPVMKAY